MKLKYDFSIIKKRWKENTTAIMNDWKQVMEGLSSFDATSIDQAFHQFVESKEIGIGQVLSPFRYLITASAAGPSMFDISEFLGKEECLKRMELGLKSVM